MREKDAGREMQKLSELASLALALTLYIMPLQELVYLHLPNYLQI